MARNLRGVTARKFKELYFGMKKAPEKIRRVSIDAKITRNKAKKRIEMKKVRPNETIEVWANRMRRFNLLSEEIIQKKLDAKKYKVIAEVKTKEHQRKYRKQKNKTIKVIFNEKDFDFLKYYGLIINFYSVKYGIRKVDLEICFAFYNNKIIDVDRFNNICILNHGNSNGFLARFKKNGYITELINKMEFEKKECKKVRINTYKLSLSMTKLITNIYEKITKLNTIHNRNYKGMYSPECEKEIIRMNAETEDYLTMNKQQLNINQIK